MSFRTKGIGSLVRLSLKAAILAIMALLIGLGTRGALVGMGAAIGCLAAAVYCWGYLRSHVDRAARDKMLDAALMSQAGVRLVVLALVSVGMWFLGRQVLMAYLIGFAIAFALLLATEIPRVTRDLRTRGLIGGGVNR